MPHHAIRFALAALVLTLPLPAAAQEAARYQLVPSETGPLVPGEDATLAVRVHFRDAAAGRRLYLLPIPMDGDRGIVGEGTMSLSNARLEMCGTFGNAPDNPYGIASEHYPLGLSATAARILGALGVSRDQVESLTGEDPDQPVSLAIGFLASIPAGRDGAVDATFTLRPPRQERWYDGLLLVPFEVTLDEGREGCARFASRRMNAVRVAVRPEGPRPADRHTTPTRTAIGELEVTGVSPAGTALVLGAANRIGVTVAYRDVPPASAIYVMLLAQRGDTIIRPDGAAFTAGAINFSTCQLEPEAGYYRISAGSRPLRLEMPYLQTVEAALVGAVPAGGTGTVTGEISFVPPPFPTRYYAIQLHPLVVWEEEGKTCTRRDADAVRALAVPVSGG